MDLSHITLVVATLLCSLTAGLVFAFAAVVMPGIAKLDDREFIRAFQVIDGVIQDNQPAFLLVWVGSIVTLVAAVALGIGEWTGTPRFLLVLAAGLYLLGVQLPTFTINVPLNNRLQSLDVDTMEPDASRTARSAFESRWVRWNTIRTGFATATAVILMKVLLDA